MGACSDNFVVLLNTSCCLRSLWEFYLNATAAGRSFLTPLSCVLKLKRISPFCNLQGLMWRVFGEGFGAWLVVCMVGLSEQDSEKELTAAPSPHYQWEG